MSCLKIHRLHQANLIRVAGLLISLCLFNAVGHGQSAATVSGDLTISKNHKSKSFSLRYVYANARGVAGRKQPDIDLDFTDQPVPEDRLERSQYISVMAREGKLHALRVTITSDKKISQSIVDSDLFLTDSSDDSEQVFEAETYADKVISGTVKSIGLVSGDIQAHEWQYVIHFKAPIDRGALTLSNLPSGGGTPGKAYSEFYNAIQAGDMPAFKSLLASETARAFDGPDAQGKLAKLKSVMKKLDKIRDGSSLFASGKSAWIMLGNGSSSSRANAPPTPGTQSGPPPVFGSIQADARLVLEGGQWKVAWVTWGPEYFNAILHPERRCC